MFVGLKVICPELYVWKIGDAVIVTLTIEVVQPVFGSDIDGKVQTTVEAILTSQFKRGELNTGRLLPINLIAIDAEGPLGQIIALTMIQ